MLDCFLKPEMYLSIIKNISIAAWLACVLSVVTVSPAVSFPRYPNVQGVKHEMDLYGPQTTSEEVIIRDIRGRPAYNLTVYAVSLNNLEIHSIEVELIGIGSPATKFDSHYEPDLLNPDRWGHGAGQRVFKPEELCPANINDPLWGGRRIFILRRMRIEVRLSDIELSERFDSIKQAHITVNVTPTASMNSRPVDVTFRGLKSCG